MLCTPYFSLLQCSVYFVIVSRSLLGQCKPCLSLFLGTSLQLRVFSPTAGNTTWSLCLLPMFQLTVTPASALADEPVHIQATGLPPLQMVTLMATTKDDKGNLYRSRAFYRANEAGELDLKRDPAVGGHYMGVHPMGLFWSLKPERAFDRLIKRDVMNTPTWITLDLYDSVYIHKVGEVQPKASQVLQRWFSSPDLQRVPIREGRVRGALFLPPGETHLEGPRKHGWWG